MTTKGVLVFLLVAGCRAAPLPPAARYPAGSPFSARFLRVAGTNLRYIDAGTGTTVIFLHGLGGSMYSWRYNLAPAESAGFRVIAFDNRGFGSSDKPAQGYSNADYSALLIAFMDSLHIPDAVLVGHSMGGAIAAETALRYPRRVRALVLIDAAGLGIHRPGVLRLLRSSVVRPLTGLRSRWITRLILWSAYADPGKIDEGAVDQYYAPVADSDFGQALRGVLREFQFDALRGRLAGIDLPTLVLWGDRDRWTPPAIGTAMATELHRVAYVPIPRTGHLAQEESPQAVNHFLIAFLKQGAPSVAPDLAMGRESSSIFSTIWLRKLSLATQAN